MEDLIHLIPDGASAVGVIIVVMLFLRQQERINMMLETITKGFNEQVHDSQATFQEQILRLTSQQYDNQRLYQEQIQSLIDAHIKVSRARPSCCRSRSKGRSRRPRTAATSAIRPGKSRVRRAWARAERLERAYST